MGTIVIVKQIIIAGIIISVGVVGVKAKVIDETVRKSISKIVFNITLPLLIFTTFVQKDISKELIINGAWVIFFATLSFLLLNVFGILSSSALKLESKERVVHILHTMFGNIVFLGFPLINAIFPEEESLLYAALYYLVSTFLQWTFAVFLLKGERNVPFFKRMKNLLNPNTIAFFIGISLMMLRVKLPDIITTPLQGVGKTTIYLCLIYIGAMLSNINASGILKRKDLFILTLNKLLIVPILIVFLIWAINSIFGTLFTGMPFVVLILEVAMPCMSMIVIMAKNYGAADDRAAENVFFTTIVSLLTLPFIYYIASYFVNNIF